MHYKPKSVAALHICLGGLPGRTRVECDRGVGVRAKTVAQLRQVTAWPENVAISTPAGTGAVKVSKANQATRFSPKA